MMYERKTTRALRNAVDVEPHRMHRFGHERGPWHESREEVRDKLAWGEAKAVLMAWVERQMDEHLTARERQCIKLYFYENMTYRQAAALTNTNASSVLRAVNRGLRKLRQAAAEDETMRALYHRRHR